MIYEVYRNLHRQQWSIRDPKTKLVVGHATSVTMEFVEAQVNETGRQRVLREQKKNVHAFLVGTVVGFVNFTSFRGRQLNSRQSCLPFKRKPLKICYNPYKRDTFYTVVSSEVVPFFTSMSHKVHLNATGQVYG